MANESTIYWKIDQRPNSAVLLMDIMFAVVGLSITVCVNILVLLLPSWRQESQTGYGTLFNTKERIVFLVSLSPSNMLMYNIDRDTAYTYHIYTKAKYHILCCFLIKIHNTTFSDLFTL